MATKTIVITGASDGIGAAAARQLATAGYRLILVGRSPEKTQAVASSIGAEFLTADFAKLEDVRELASAIAAETEGIDVLANNAGGIFGDRTLTVDGHEKILQVNHLAPFLLTNLLLPQLLAAKGSVINTASSAAKILASLDIDDLENEKAYTPNKAYGDAKLGNILFTRGLQAKYGVEGINSVAFDPGNVRTNFASDTTSAMRAVYRWPLSRILLISPEKGGANLAHFVSGEADKDWTPGGFYTQTKPAEEKNTNPMVHDDELVSKHWNLSAELLGLSIA